MDENFTCVTCKQVILPGGETLDGNIHIVIEDGIITGEVKLFFFQNHWNQIMNYGFINGIECMN